MAQVVWNPDIDVYNPSVIPFSVAKTITWWLDVRGLINFSKVSKNAYKAVNDPLLWVLLLKKMGVWESGVVPRRDELRGCRFDWMNDPLTCFDKVFKVSKMAKFQVVKILTALYGLYDDLQNDVPYDQLKVFRKFHTPSDQARILKNLLKFNAINPNESVSTMVHDKICELIEMFENALLRELEIHYDIKDYDRTREFVMILLDLKNEQNLIDFFLQKTCFDNDSIKLLSPDSFKVADYFVEVKEEKDNKDIDNEEKENEEKENEEKGNEEKENEEEEKKWRVNFEQLDSFIDQVAGLFNQEANVIDLIFPQSIPMMYKISEEIVSNQLQDVCLLLVSTAKEKGRNAYFEMTPLLYTKLTHDLILKLKPSANIGENYHHLIRQLIDSSLESIVSEYAFEEKTVLEQRCTSVVEKWNHDVVAREKETQQQILKHVRVEAKNDFLSNFKKVFTIAGASSKDKSDGDLDNNQGLQNYSTVQAQAKILAENIKSLNRIFSPELALDLLNDAKLSLARLHQFGEFSVSAVKLTVFATMQDQFIKVIEGIASDHLRPGLERALKYLNNYSPKHVDLFTSGGNSNAIEPLVIFFQAINMADMIVQMVDIFYKEEMIHRKVVKHENSVLNPSLQTKKNLESMVDKFVADGLNIGIDVLFREIESVYISELKDKDYCPPPGTQTLADGPTGAAKHAIRILDDNVDLLVDCADKSIVEVFQQEVAERFFQLIVKILKRSTISVDGAVTLISDLNFYHDFIIAHIKAKKRLIFPLFQALKKVGSIYLISGDEAKAIGQLVSDLSKFNGIFSQEEIYEFVQRRQDWPLIKRHVEKVMYGISLGDCTII